MRVVIDMQSIQTESAFRGIGRYSLSLIRETLRIRKGDDFFLLFNNKAKINCDTSVLEEIVKTIGKNNLIYFPVYDSVNYFALSAIDRRHVELMRERCIELINPDILIITSLFETDAITTVPRKQDRSYSTAVILYDLIPLSCEKEYLPQPMIKEWYYDKLNHLKNADIYLTISQYSMDYAIDKIDIDRDSCVNILGASDLLDYSHKDKLNLKFDIPQHFVFYVGGFDHRKNVADLIESFARQPSKIRNKYSLVLAGKILEQEKNKYISLAKRNGLSLNKLIFLGYVNNNDLIFLYKHCSLFVFPSLNEGFGLPPLEAMGFGAPVIVANAGSLPEVVENADCLFTPSVSEMIKKITRSLTNKHFREGLLTHSKKQSLKFSWKKVSNTAFSFIEKMVKNIALDSNVKRHDTFIHELAELCTIDADCIKISKIYSLLLCELRKKINISGDFNVSDIFVTAVPNFDMFKSPYVFSSGLCRQQHFHLPLYTYWCRCLGESPKLHRKQWEFVYICQVLHERGYLREGMSAVGFGVGKEPLVPYFASQEVDVLATDLQLDRAIELGWTNNNEHCAGILSLNEDELCEEKLFLQRTKFRTVDMNNIETNLGKFDFCWSSCAFEHLGSIRKGLDFVLNSADLLKPGGMAVHTTEFNITSNDRTLDNNPTFVIFRRKDIEQLADELAQKGYEMEPIDFSSGEDELERYVDLPPYIDEPHLRLQLAGEFTSTSLGIIIRAPNT